MGQCSYDVRLPQPTYASTSSGFLPLPPISVDFPVLTSVSLTVVTHGPRVFDPRKALISPGGPAGGCVVTDNVTGPRIFLSARGRPNQLYKRPYWHQATHSHYSDTAVECAGPGRNFGSGRPGSRDVSSGRDRWRTPQASNRWAPGALFSYPVPNRPFADGHKSRPCCSASLSPSTFCAGQRVSFILCRRSAQARRGLLERGRQEGEAGAFRCHVLCCLSHTGCWGLPY